MKFTTRFHALIISLMLLIAVIIVIISLKKTWQPTSQVQVGTTAPSIFQGRQIQVKSHKEQSHIKRTQHPPQSLWKTEEKHPVSTDAKEVITEGTGRNDDESMESFFKQFSEGNVKLPMPPVDDENYNYSDYDAIFNDSVTYVGGRRFNITLDMIGIPIDITDISPPSTSFQPTPEEQRRYDELKRQAQEAYNQGDRDRFRRLEAERIALNDRCMRPDPGSITVFGRTGGGGKLPDGTQLWYYRRLDGALMRQVTKPDGTVRKWVVSWADPESIDKMSAKPE